MEEQRIAICKNIVNQIYVMLQSSPNEWQLYIASARSVLASIDATTFMRDPARAHEQIWLIDGLQSCAYHDADRGGIVDIADWCLKQWLTVVQSHPHNVKILQGIGHWWLLRAQPHLARIHTNEGSSSSSSSSSSNSARAYALTLTRSEEERQAQRDGAAAEARVQTADYVEARGLLLPATEYYARAVQNAYAQGVVTGPLLENAAEAHMSLGNVSSARVNQNHFCQAIAYLRMAAAIPGFRLPGHLLQYLNEYGHLAGQ